MSNLTDFFGSAASTLAADPLAQPCFYQVVTGHWGMNNSKIVYDHALRPVSWQHYGNGASGSNHMMAPFSNSDVFSASGTPGTGQQQVYQFKGGTGFNTFLGHSYFSGSSQDNTAIIGGKVSKTNRAIAGVAAKSCGVSIGEDQDYALITGNRHAPDRTVGTLAGFYIVPRSVAEAVNIYRETGGPQYGDRANNTGKGGVRVQAAGVLTTGYRMAMGGVCYNQRTKKLVILERSSGDAYFSQWRPVLIHNAPNPADYVNRSDDYQTALTAVTATSSNRVVGPVTTVAAGTNAAEMSSYLRPILSDDNSVTFLGGAFQGTGCPLVKWTFSSGAFNAATVVSTATANAAWSGGSPWEDKDTVNAGGGTNFQMSLDGKTICLFQQTYYFCSGIQFCMVNTETGGLSKIYRQHSTDNGYNVIPYGASNFMIGEGYNAAAGSGGAYATTFNWKAMDAEAGGSGTYTGEVTMPTTWRVQAFDSSYYSTMYPQFGMVVEGVDNKAIIKASTGKWNTQEKLRDVRNN